MLDRTKVRTNPRNTSLRSTYPGNSPHGAGFDARTIAETAFDGGRRRAQTAQARAVYDGSVASYRETVLTAFQQVEDNIAALRILQGEAQVQDEAVKAAQQTVIVTTNQYRAGIVSYLNVIVAQTGR